MERYVATQFYKADSPESRILRESGIAPSEFVLAADAQATIAALQARVQELEQWVQDQSTANLETMRHTDEMQSRALEAEQQLTQRTAELERVRLLSSHNERRFEMLEEKYKELCTLSAHIAALPKVEGEITCSQQFDSAWRLQYWQVEAYGVADECLYRLSNLGEEEAKAYAALLKHRQEME